MLRHIKTVGISHKLPDENFRCILFAYLDNETFIKKMGIVLKERITIFIQL